MVRRRRQEVHVNQERWLISYADFITLLFAFFVVMYSISQVNDSKYRVLSDTFVEAFNQPGSTHVNPNVQSQTASTHDPITPVDTGATAATESDENGQISIVSDGPPPSTATDTEHQPPPIKTSDELTQISDLVSEKFVQLINDQLVQVSSNELWLQIELKDSILF